MYFTPSKSVISEQIALTSPNSITMRFQVVSWFFVGSLWMRFSCLQNAKTRFWNDFMFTEWKITLWRHFHIYNMKTIFLKKFHVYKMGISFFRGGCRTCFLDVFFAISFVFFREKLPYLNNSLLHREIRLQWDFKSWKVTESESRKVTFLKDFLNNKILLDTRQ